MVFKKNSQLILKKATGFPYFHRHKPFFLVCKFVMLYHYKFTNRMKFMENRPLGWESFLDLCAKINSEEELDHFFDLFLTIEEKHLLASRTLIIKELLEDTLPQREIAKKHKVSIAQITRGSNALKRANSSIKSFLQKNLLHWWR